MQGSPKRTLQPQLSTSDIADLPEEELDDVSAPRTSEGQ
jgi:hypothetical protein